MADYLCRRHGFIKIAFADRIKTITREVYDFSEAQLYGPLKEVPDLRYKREDGTFLTPREAFQKLGDEWGRGCYRNTWVDLTLRTARLLLDGTHTYTAIGGLKKRWFRSKPSGVVISDVRYQNEVAAVRATGSVVRLLASHPRGMPHGLGKHPSETSLRDVPAQLFADTIQVPAGLHLYYREIDTFLLRLQKRARAA